MYLDFFKLRAYPFNITPDPAYLYYTPHHRAAVEHLIYGITARKGFIELTGEVGCGKTTVCRAVLSRLGDRIKSALILNPCLSDAELLRAIVADFGLDPSGQRIDQLERLNAFLLEQARLDCTVVLIIDEAQNLSAPTMEQIRLLSNLETDQQKLIQIVLSGQPELKQRLASVELRQLRQRITVRYHIPALACSEVGHYIHHRLRLAGAPADVEFTPEAVERVVAYSEGIPRKINALCDYTMLAGYVMNARQLGPVCVDRAIHQLEEGL